MCLSFFATLLEASSEFPFVFRSKDSALIINPTKFYFKHSKAFSLLYCPPISLEKLLDIFSSIAFAIKASDVRNRPKDDPSLYA
jgi:hypothetical protein